MTSKVQRFKLFSDANSKHKKEYKGGDKLTYKYNKLRGRIIEKFGSQVAFAEAVGLSKTQLSKKMTGKAGFDQNDIVKWCGLLDIPVEEAGLYFFV